MAKTQETNKIVIPEIKAARLDIVIVGDTPLIVHAWSKKAKEEMLAKHMKVAKAAKAAKDPFEAFRESLYRLPDGGYGFPSVAFKAAAVTAVTSVDGMTKVAARQVFRVVGEQIEVPAAFQLGDRELMCRMDLVRIRGSEPQIREDTVRVGMGKADIRYRGEFWPWFARLTIAFNERVFSAAQIVNLFNFAGFGVGVGEWRSERDGQYGSFHLASEAEAARLHEDEKERVEALAAAAAELPSVGGRRERAA